MTGMEEVLAAHQIVSRSNCDCGQRLTFGPFKPLKTHAEAYAAHVAQALADAGFGSLHDAWAEGIEAGFDYAANQSTPSGMSIDPPANPYPKVSES